MLTRLAPTPSGYIHQGNIYNFLLNWLWARSNNGKVMLRIDDGDTERKRKEYVEDIFQVLDWLGLDWDIGPAGPDDFEKNWSQLKRRGLYEDLLTELEEKELLYACACSRKQICQCADKGISLSQNNVALKIKAGKEFITFIDKITGEVTIGITPFVVRKKDGFAAYQLCSLADDRYFNVTHICRGDDLKESSAMQLYIDRKLSQPCFHQCIFWHHSLLTSPDGQKFSKSTGTNGQSIIHHIERNDLLLSFAQWLKLNIIEEITLSSLLSMKVFQNTPQ